MLSAVVLSIITMSILYCVIRPTIVMKIVILLSIVTMSIITMSVVDMCCFGECHHTACHYAERHYMYCRYAEWCGSLTLVAYLLDKGHKRLPSMTPYCVQFFSVITKKWRQECVILTQTTPVRREYARRTARQKSRKSF
jgi:hypothetical protein